MQNFQTYAKYYDALYREKEYIKEADFVRAIIEKYSPIKVKQILSLGCGTASHDIVLAKKGFSILGIDRSAQMLAIAKEKIKTEGVSMALKQADISRFKLSKKYDMAMAMFNVVGYVTENETMEKMLQCVNVSLNKKGLFMFDCWYGPAVLKDRPQNRSKGMVIGGKKITKITQTKFNIEKSLLDMRIIMKENGKVASKESHQMRFWYAKELEYFLTNNGFKIIKMCNFMGINSQISENNWNMFVVAQKIS